MVTSGDATSNESTASLSSDDHVDCDFVPPSEEIPIVHSTEGDENSFEINQKIDGCSPECKGANAAGQRHKQLHNMIANQEVKNANLKIEEEDMRRRCEMLELVMPALVAKDILKLKDKEEFDPVQFLEKKIQEVNFVEFSLPCTSSNHHNIRVRETEAEKKRATLRLEEAQVLWEEKQKLLECLRKEKREIEITNQELESKAEKLELQMEEKNSKLNEKNDCSDYHCWKPRLGDSESCTSMTSSNLDCLIKFQEVAEATLCIKRNIADLERKECEYMRTFQRAGQFLSKANGDIDKHEALKEVQWQKDLGESDDEGLSDPEYSTCPEDHSCWSESDYEGEPCPPGMCFGEEQMESARQKIKSEKPLRPQGNEMHLKNQQQKVNEAKKWPTWTPKAASTFKLQDPISPRIEERRDNRKENSVSNEGVWNGRIEVSKDELEFWLNATEEMQRIMLNCSGAVPVESVINKMGREISAHLRVKWSERAKSEGGQNFDLLTPTSEQYSFREKGYISPEATRREQPLLIEKLSDEKPHRESQMSVEKEPTSDGKLTESQLQKTRKGSHSKVLSPLSPSPRSFRKRKISELDESGMGMSQRQIDKSVCTSDVSTNYISSRNMSPDNEPLPKLKKLSQDGRSVKCELQDIPTPKDKRSSRHSSLKQEKKTLDKFSMVSEYSMKIDKMHQKNDRMSIISEELVSETDEAPSRNVDISTSTQTDLESSKKFPGKTSKAYDVPLKPERLSMTEYYERLSMQKEPKSKVSQEATVSKDSPARTQSSTSSKRDFINDKTSRLVLSEVSRDESTDTRESPETIDFKSVNATLDQESHGVQPGTFLEHPREQITTERCIKNEEKSPARIQSSISFSREFMSDKTSRLVSSELFGDKSIDTKEFPETTGFKSADATLNQENDAAQPGTSLEHPREQIATEMCIKSEEKAPILDISQQNSKGIANKPSTEIQKFQDDVERSRLESKLSTPEQPTIRTITPLEERDFRTTKPVIRSKQVKAQLDYDNNEFQSMGELESAEGGKRMDVPAKSISKLIETVEQSNDKMRRSMQATDTETPFQEFGICNDQTCRKKDASNLRSNILASTIVGGEDPVREKKVRSSEKPSHYRALKTIIIAEPLPYSKVRNSFSDAVLSRILAAQSKDQPRRLASRSKSKSQWVCGESQTSPVLLQSDSLRNTSWTKIRESDTWQSSGDSETESICKCSFSDAEMSFTSTLSDSSITAKKNRKRTKDCLVRKEEPVRDSDCSCLETP